LYNFLVARMQNLPLIFFTKQKQTNHIYPTFQIQKLISENSTLHLLKKW
jgi:hypothetical protein